MAKGISPGLSFVDILCIGSIYCVRGIIFVVLCARGSQNHVPPYESVSVCAE